MKHVAIAMFIVLGMNCWAQDAVDAKAKEELIAATEEIARYHRLVFESHEKMFKRGQLKRSVFVDSLLAKHRADARLACVKGDKEALIAELSKIMEYYEKRRESITRLFDKGGVARSVYREALLNHLEAKAKVAQAKVYGCAAMFAQSSN